MAGVAIRPRTPFESSKTSPVVVLVRVDMVGRDKSRRLAASGVTHVTPDVRHAWPAFALPAA